MAKTITEELLELLGPEAQAEARTKLQSRPDLVARDAKGTELYGFWSGTDDDSTTAPVVHTPTVPVTATAAAAVTPTVTPTTVTPTAAAPTSAAMDAAALEALIDGKVARIVEGMKKDYVPVSELPKYRGEMQSNMLALADEWLDVKVQHQAEFGERLDKEVVNKFVNDNGGPGKFRSVTDAYNAMVGEKRTEKKIADGIEAGVKQKMSAQSVPAQTMSTASPSLAVIAKAKTAASGAGDGTSAVMAAAQRLRQMRQNRDGAGAE